MDVYETDLPGVGKRFEVETESGDDVIVVVHNSGRRELFRRPEPDADSEELLDLTDEEARVLGSIIEGAYFQPIPTDVRELEIGTDVSIEWYTLEEDSAIVGQTLEGAALRAETGVTVLAVQRGDDVISNPEPEFDLEIGDVLVTVGTREEQTAFEEFLSE